jgi:hypothetical protein
MELFLVILYSIPERFSIKNQTASTPGSRTWRLLPSCIPIQAMLSSDCATVACTSGARGADQEKHCLLSSTCIRYQPLWSHSPEREHSGRTSE